jgi:hypothetical protein
MSRLMVPEQRRASVGMAPSRQGSVTRHGLADSAKIKTSAARAQARRRMRREVANAVKGCGAAKDKGKWEAAGQGTVQCERAQRHQEINGNMGAFAVAVAPPDLHSHALLPRTVVEALTWMLPGGKQQLTKSLRRAGRLECGRSANCPRDSRLYQAALFFFERKQDGQYKARLVAGGAPAAAWA